MLISRFRSLHVLWFVPIAVLAVACGGGHLATVPLPTATPAVGAAAQSGIAVPQGGGVVQLPPAGGMANSFTFRPGNPAGLSLNVQTFSFGQTSIGTATASNQRRPQDATNIDFSICPDVTAVSFAVSVDTPLAQLGSYDFSPLPFYIRGFQSGTFAVQVYDTRRGAFIIDHANWELTFHNDPNECKPVLMSELFPDDYQHDSLLPAPMLVGTGSFSNGSIVSFPFTPAQVGSTILKAGDTYVMFAAFTPGAVATGSPNPIPTITPVPSPSPSPSPSSTASPIAAASAAGSLSINPGSGNIFLGNPPAALGLLSPSLFYSGTIAGIVAPMSASYLEVAGASPHACPITGTVIYSLEVTYPNTFAFATTGSGYMATIITPGTADGTSYHATLFRAGACATLAGPSGVAVSGGTLSFVGGGALTINANETDVVEFWH